MTPEPGAGCVGRWWPSPAKLNLFLHVTGRRADGLHTLQTLFQILDWGDSVRLRITDDGQISRRDVDYGVAEDQDLVVHAARALQSATDTNLGAEIEVRKEIPLGAGLGGGSSNAATVLLALNRLWGCGLDLNALATIGLGLGADVPVFVRGQTAMATGVGDVLVPAELGQQHYLLVMPDIRVSTAEVYSDPALRRDSKPISIDAAIAGKGRNDCQPVACARYPELTELMYFLAAYGSPRMSGTGSALFLPMASRAAAERAGKAVRGGSASELKCRYNVRAVGGLDQSPLHRALGKAPAEASV